MKITVILCTYNRCKSLTKALESIAASRLPESLRWEVLVVDNNSNDGTAQVVESFRSRYPDRFRYIFESRPGKSNALNTGVQNSDADALAFMDDDVTVGEEWLYKLTAPLLNGDWTGAGGPIVPERTFSPPLWLPIHERYGLAPLAMFNLGDEPGELKESPFGTNMAVRRTVFKVHQGFRTDLGPSPTSEIRSEDTEFCDRLLAAGERFWYEPSAVVYHSLPANRMQKQYFLKWWFDRARADIRLEGIQGKTSLGYGIPIHLYRGLAIWTVRWLLAIHPRRRFSAKIKVWGKCGAIVECYRTAAESRKKVKSSVPETSGMI